MMPATRRWHRGGRSGEVEFSLLDGGDEGLPLGGGELGYPGCGVLGVADRDGVRVEERDFDAVVFCPAQAALAPRRVGQVRIGHAACISRHCCSFAIWLISLCESSRERADMRR